MSEKQCRHAKDDGERCGVTFGLSDDGLCVHHDPERRDLVRRARSDGGRTTAEKRRKRPKMADEDLPPLTSHEAAETWTDRIGRAAATGRMSATAANAALRAVQTWESAREAGKVSEELQAFKDALAVWRKTGDAGAVLELVEGGKS